MCHRAHVISCHALAVWWWWVLWLDPGDSDLINGFIPWWIHNMMESLGGKVWSEKAVHWGHAQKRYTLCWVLSYALFLCLCLSLSPSVSLSICISLLDHHEVSSLFYNMLSLTIGPQQWSCLRSSAFGVKTSPLLTQLLSQAFVIVIEDWVTQLQMHEFSETQWQHPVRIHWFRVIKDEK